jgi:glycosyltransferase involved in cell wall biosynthesis
VIGWLVNDLLTAIPGSKTLWHRLLEWLPGLQDKTGVPFPLLAARIERDAAVTGSPEYLVRNASYFRALELDRPTISLLQDVQQGSARAAQLEVCRRSRRVVVNSRRTLGRYPELDPARTSVVPVGVDFDFFRPGLEPLPGIEPDSVLFVGAANDYPKGFDRLRALIDETDLPFCLVLKDGFPFQHPRARVFSSVDARTLARIYNSCRLLVCTSREETQHLAGIEAAACGKPIVATRVGAYADLPPGPWGRVVDAEDLPGAVREVSAAAEPYSPRRCFEPIFGLAACRRAWETLVEEVVPEEQGGGAS